MPLECDNFVFRKVNWPLLLRRGGSVGFRLTAKWPLSVTKPNCQHSLMQKFKNTAMGKLTQSNEWFKNIEQKKTA